MKYLIRSNCLLYNQVAHKVPTICQSYKIASFLNCSTCRHVIVNTILNRIITEKKPSGDQRRGIFDVTVINLTLCNDVQIVQERTTPPPELPNLNISKVKYESKVDVHYELDWI